MEISLNVSTVLFLWASAFTLVGFSIGFVVGTAIEPKPKRDARGRFCK